MHINWENKTTKYNIIFAVRLTEVNTLEYIKSNKLGTCIKLENFQKYGLERPLVTMTLTLESDP